LALARGLLIDQQLHPRWTRIASKTERRSSIDRVPLNLAHFTGA